MIPDIKNSEYFVPTEIKNLSIPEICSLYFTIYPNEISEFSSDSKPGVTAFYHGPLSNWWYSPFGIYTCMEQYMMAMKAAVFHDTDIYKKIIACRGPWDGSQKDFNQYPREHLRLGRLVKNFDPEKWDHVCKNIVLTGTLQKFEANPLLKDLLKTTQGTLLVEASPTDKIWGVGLKRSDPEIAFSEKWNGKNYLGTVLMNARDLLF